MADAQGLPEPGIDGGGLTREFLTDVLKKGFGLSVCFYCSSSIADPDVGFFKLNGEGELYPNAQASFINENFADVSAAL